MITATHTVEIDRPVTEVFDYVTDQRNEPKWHTDVLEAEPKAPIKLGSTLTWTVRFMGVKQYISEVTAFDPPNLIRIETREGPLKPTLTHSFEQQNGSAIYTRSLSIPTEGIFRLVGPIMKVTGAAKRRNAGFAQNLKTILETSVEPT